MLRAGARKIMADMRYAWRLASLALFMAGKLVESVNADEAVKQRLMPIVRDLIQTVVIGKTPGHQPASLQVHGDIAHIMASMDVIDILQQQFIAAAQNDLMTRLASGEIDTEAKKNKLIEAYIDELSRKLPEWENLQVSLVAGA